MTNREPPPPGNWTKGGPVREQPKPFTIGGPAPQT
jgi:cell division protease FtsH